MMIFDFLFLEIFFAIGFFFVTLFRFSLQSLGKFTSKHLIRENKPLFFTLFQKVFPKNDWNQLHLLLHLSQTIFLLLTVFCFFTLSPYHETLYASLWILFGFIIVDGCARFLGSRWPSFFLFFSLPLSTFYLLLLFPLTGLLTKWLSFAKVLPDEKHLLKERMFDILKESGIYQLLETSDQKILSSLVTFKEKVAREVMVPRVNLFSLPSDTSIKKAARFFIKHGYSRIPVYKNSLDTIIGVVMYKDILHYYLQNEEFPENHPLNQTIEKLIKPVIYAPENKKISQLFQECKNKQTHIAIIVNEYGGTEGIVTIEDILEELVGDIEDEYDVEEERFFKKLPNGSFIVNAKMTILDLEHKLDIKIPHHTEYETIGGYVFHRAGTIPEKGWRLHHDDFEMEVLDSNERCLEKIRLTPIKKVKSE